jgi:hypothetical protein
MEQRREPLSTPTRGLSERLRQDGRQQLETRKRVAADQIDELAHALGRAGEQLDQSQPRLAGYANQIASGVSNFATRLRDGRVEDLLDDARRAAHRNPGLFLLGGFALGVALARFLKASDRSEETDFSGEFAEASAEQREEEQQEEQSPQGYSSSLAAREQSRDQPYTPGSGG